MIYDEEFMIRDAADLFKAKLNAEIVSINTEKNDALALDEIPADKYIFETLDKRLLNYTGFFILYGLLDTPLREVNIDNMIEDVTMTFQVGTFDKGEKERSNTMYKLLRYRRALKQVIIKNPDVFRGYAKPLLKSLKPDSLPFDRNNVILKIGIDLKASVTAN